MQLQGKAGPASFIMGSLSSGADKVCTSSHFPHSSTSSSSYFLPLPTPQVRERQTLEQKVDATTSKLEDVSRMLLARARADGGEQPGSAAAELGGVPSVPLPLPGASVGGGGGFNSASSVDTAVSATGLQPALLALPGLALSLKRANLFEGRKFESRPLQGVSVAVSAAVAASVKDLVRGEVRKELAGMRQEMAELKALLAGLTGQQTRGGERSPHGGASHASASHAASSSWSPSTSLFRALGGEQRSQRSQRPSRDEHVCAQV